MPVITIGRSSTNTITINDPSVSRHHADIIYKGDGLAIKDKGSKNGTMVNGKRLTPDKEYFIYRGDVILLADNINLDWSLVPETPPLLTIIKTSLGRGLMSLMNLVTDANILFQIFIDFKIIVLSGGSRIMERSTRSKLSKTIYVFYFYLGMTAFLISMIKSAKELAPQGSILVVFSQYISEHMDHWILIDFLASLFFLLLNFLLVFTIYKIFKWYTEKPKKHFNDYFKIFCYTFGTTYWLLAISLLPLFIGCMNNPDVPLLGWHSVSVLTGIAMASISLYSFFIWVKLNDQFWA